MERKLFSWLHILVPSLLGIQLVFPDSVILLFIDLITLFSFGKLMTESYTGKTIHEKLLGYFRIILVILCAGLIFERKDHILIGLIIFIIAYFAERKYCLFSTQWK